MALGVVLLLAITTGIFVIVKQGGGPGGGQPAADRVDPNAAGFQKLLKRRNEAILNKDEKAWMEFVDPTDAAFVAKEKMRFANWTQMPVKVFRLYSTLDYVLWPEKIKGYNVSLEVQFIGDPRAHSMDYGYYLIFEKGVPKLTNVDHHQDHDNVSDALTTHVPWDLEPLRFAKKPGVTVVTAKDSKYDPAKYATIASRGVEYIRKVWGNRPGTTDFIVLLADAKQYNEWFGYGKLNGSIFTAGYASCKLPYNDGSPVKADGQGSCRVVLNMPRLEDDLAFEVVTHEMGHAVGPQVIPSTSGLAGYDPAQWVTEGFAQWMALGAQGTRAFQRSSSFVKRHWSKYDPTTNTGMAPVPANEDFFSDDDTKASFNYEASALFFYAVEKVAGKKAAVDLYLAIGGKGEFSASYTRRLSSNLTAVGANPTKVFQTYKSLVQ